MSDFYVVNVWVLRDGEWVYWGQKRIHRDIGMLSAWYKVAGELGMSKHSVRVHEVHERRPS